MWRTLVFVGLLAGLNAHAVEPAAKRESPDSKRVEAQAEQQARIQALARRGRDGTYQQLLAASKSRPITSIAAANGTRVQLTAAQADAVSREASIDLAALGFTAADVTAYRKRNVDLFDVARRFYSGSTSFAERALMADTVVIATAGKVIEGRSRLDGFLSSWPYTVVRTLKGSRAAGDTIYLPRKSGITANSQRLHVSSEPDVTPGKRYLLVLSKNTYEQRVAQKQKQAEAGFNALPYLIYEISGDGTLLGGPQPNKWGSNPKDVAEVESDLKKLSL